jgi:hypothetical protein
MKVLGTFDDAHLVETKSRKITYQRQSHDCGDR